MRRALLAGGMLVLASVSGCADQTEKYCSTVKDDQQELTDLRKNAGKPGNDFFGESLAVLEGFRDEAPDDIVDEWDTIVFGWQGLAEAIEAAGVDAGEYQAGNRPPGVSDAEAKAIEGAALKLASSRVVDASDGIEQHARDVCKVDLGL